MNTSTRLDFLINSTANNVNSSSKQAESSLKGLEFKKQFTQQLQASNGQKSQERAPAQDVNNKTNALQKNESSSTADKQPIDSKQPPVDEKQLVDGKSPVDETQLGDEKKLVDETQLGDEKQLVDGETLPMSEEARKFLAALSEEDQELVIEEVRQWLASLSPEELQKLQQQLAENPEQLAEMLPQELQELLAKLQDIDLKDFLVPEGFSDFLASLVNADLDFQRVAISVRGEPLSLVTKDLASKEDAFLSKLSNKFESKQQASDQGASRQDKLSELVASLDKASSQGLVRSGGDSLSQLLQSAGAGIGIGAMQAAGPATQTVARMAAGFTSMPLMMQAAADSNAQALANRISMMNAKNMQVAEMRLDPPNLGSIRVQIRMQGDQASVVFQAANPHARELLEQSLPKLREMMEAEGLMLADAQVSEESFAGQDQGEKQKGSEQYAGSGLAENDEVAEGAQIPLLSEPLGLIDYYA